MINPSESLNHTERAPVATLILAKKALIEKPTPYQIKEALIARIVRDSKPGDPTEEEIRHAIEESERTPRMA